MFFLLRFLLQGHETSQVRKELSSDRKEVESFVGLMEAVTQASNEASGMVLTDARRRHFNNMIRSKEIVLTSKLRNLQVEEEAWLSLKMKFMNKDLFRSSSICVVDRNDELRKDDEEVEEGNFEFDDEFGSVIDFNVVSQTKMPTKSRVSSKGSNGGKVASEIQTKVEVFCGCLLSKY